MSFWFRMSVVVGMLSSFGTVRAAEPANLIKEPSFEGAPGDNGLPSEWYGLHAMPDGKYRMSLADTARTGKKSLLIAGDGQYGVVWGEKLKVDRKLRYRARGSVKIEGDEPAAADVKLLIASDDEREFHLSEGEPDAGAGAAAERRPRDVGQDPQHV